ncbi:MAG TPA: phosphoenolpyruvate mutase [Candidatus Limnocylindrales bacterium]|nr:phosphoenolpyruvate mutase [Candidatus Limnocylindrales bacterium]
MSFDEQFHRSGLNGHSAARTPGRKLRDQLGAGEPCQLMGAHDGLSARIAVAEGFDALWASGLCMSTALGVRDSDEASWTQLLTIVETMVEVVNAPILVDGDTGYGNFNTARRFSTRAERIGAAGISLEDKIFPKMNSFFGDDHALAPESEFCGKIKACKDAQSDPDFVLVARTEAMIAGLGVEVALERAEAYVAAGADAVFIHSRQPTAEQIESFMSSWHDRAPVVIAPTTYHTVTVGDFKCMGISGIIWANQSMRAAFTAMRDTCREVKATGGVFAVESSIASLKEIFSLLHYHQLDTETAKYASFTPTPTSPFRTEPR